MKYLLLALLTFATSAIATPYQMDMEENIYVKFSGAHAGDKFEGVFEDWKATINFDKDDLDGSSVTVTFNTASAKTGNAMYDGTLPSTDWFDVKNHPQAIFQSTSFVKIDDGFQVTGDLTIKSITHPITFDFMLEGDNPTIMTASFPIDRLKYDIGKGSDAKAEWVSQNIDIDIRLSAVKQ